MFIWNYAKILPECCLPQSMLLVTDLKTLKIVMFLIHIRLILKNRILIKSHFYSDPQSWYLHNLMSKSL
jgi:hypothetical protein